MFTHPGSVQSYYSRSTPPSDRDIALREALVLYESVHFTARWHNIWSLLTGRRRHLLSLDASLQGSRLQGASDVGVREVLIEQIRGSEGRAKDFDGNFWPLHVGARDRWIGIAAAKQLDLPLPAVDLIQVGDTYFVRDGHHRISVAKARGQAYIEAQVIRVEISPSSTARPSEEGTSPVTHPTG